MGQRKRRADGLLERKRTIDGKVVHFYGHTLAEVEQKLTTTRLNWPNGKRTASCSRPSTTTG